MILLALLAVFLTLFAGACYLLYLFWRYFFLPFTRRVRTEIHPDYQQVVDFTRAHLARNANGGTSANANSGAEPEVDADDDTDASPREGVADRCPVCMDDMQFAVATNCGHNFCGRCIITYWHTGHWTGAVGCPMCRATVNLILPMFSAEEQRQSRQDEDGEGRSLLAEIALYNRRYSGAPVPLWEQIRDLPVILPHLLSRLFSLDGLDFMYRARILIILTLGALYMLSPVDLLPEIVFGLLGVLDDVLVVLMVSIYAVSIYRQYLAAGN